MTAVLLALGLVLAACGPRLTPPVVELPDLRGTWTGTWGGTPLTLLVLEQHGAVAPGGVYVGRWPVGGTQVPALSGVLTFTVREQPISVNFQGSLGDLEGRLTLVVDALTQNGERLVLTRVTHDRLAGRGTSRPSWEPQGPVELVRVR